MKRSTSCQCLCSHRWKTLLALIAIVSLITGMLGISDMPQASAAWLPRPCDIYATTGTPCVAAHSTVRALFASYNGPLYQVQRASDQTYLNIGLLSAGGYANADAQVSFCSGTTCTITRIYDQTANHNDLTISWGGSLAWS